MIQSQDVSTYGQISSNGLLTSRNTDQTQTDALPRLIRVNSQTKRLLYSKEQEQRGSLALINGKLSLQKKYKLLKKKAESEIEEKLREIECLEIEIRKRQDEVQDIQEKVKEAQKNN